MPIEHESVPEYPEVERDYHRDQDEKENRETTPPSGEVVGHPAIMMAECYVGGDLERLTLGLRSLGHSPQDNYVPDDYFAWAEAVRRTSNSGGWTRAGSYVRRGTERAWMGDEAVEMPEDFDRIDLRAYSPTPAIVVLVGVFQLAGDAANFLDDELRTNRYLRLDVEGRFTHFVSAAHRKREAVDQERLRIRESARSWLSEQLPGTLTRDFRAPALPAIDFISTRLTRPFEEAEEPGGRRDDYRSILSIGQEHQVWESESHKGWRLMMPWRPRDDDWTLVVGAIDDPAFQYTGQARGNDEVDPHPRATPAFQDYFGELLVRWALVNLTVLYVERLASIRDSIATTPDRRWFSRQGRPTRGSLRLASSVIATTSFDAAVVASETAEMVDSEWRWIREVGLWVPVEEWAKERAEGSLFEDLGEGLKRRCEWIADLEARLRDQLLATTNLEVAALNISLQRQVFWITLIAVAIAVATLVVSS